MSDLERGLRSAMEEHAASPSRPAAWDDVVRRGRRRRSVHRARTAGALTMALGLVVAGVGLSRTDGDPPAGPVGPAPSPSVQPTEDTAPAPSASAPPTADAPPVAAVRISADLRRVVIPVPLPCTSGPALAVDEPEGGDVEITLDPDGAAAPADCVGDAFGAYLVARIRPLGDRNVLVNGVKTRVFSSSVLLTATSLPKAFAGSQRLEYTLPVEDGPAGYAFRWSGGDFQLNIEHDGPTRECATVRNARVRSTTVTVCGRDRDPATGLEARWAERGHSVVVGLGPAEGQPATSPYAMSDLLEVVADLVPAT